MSDPYGTDETLAKLGDTDPARGKLAVTLFDWTQSAADVWRGSNNAVRREILDAVCLNHCLNDVTLVLQKRKPFDAFAERPFLKNSRDDSRCTIVNEIAGLRLVRSLFPETVEFKGDAVLQLVEPGLYSKLR